MKTLLLPLLGLLACAGSRPPGATAAPPADLPPLAVADASALQPRTLEVGDRDRHYLLWVPDRCRGQDPVPLVLVLHRRGGSAAQAARDYGMREVAASAGFVVAYPEAATPLAWSAGGIPLGDAEADLAFLLQLLDALAQELPIDPDRVYCCGHSSGGIMAYDFALHVPDRLAAIGVVAGSLGARGQHGRPLPPGPPVSVVHVHGTADDQVPYDAQHARGARFDLFVSAPDSVAAWAARNGCGPAIHSGGPGERTERHPDGRNGTEVVLHTLVGAGHAWPVGAPGAGGPPFVAADVLWQFFAAHPRRRA